MWKHRDPGPMCLNAPTGPTGAVVGGDPAGLMAAEVLVEGGAHVNVFDAMPSVGRKLLRAGAGGANRTHSDPADVYFYRYRSRTDRLVLLLRDFGPGDRRGLAAGFGVKAGLLRELAEPACFRASERPVSAIKSLPLLLTSPRPLDEAISTAGGVPFEALDDRLMPRSLPGSFCTGRERAFA